MLPCQLHNMARTSATSRKLAALKVARILRSGGLIAHHTDTLPGIAALPGVTTSVYRLCRFKQRQGPFLLLADSIKTAMQQARYYSPALRRLVRHNWPGPVTLIIPARPGLPKQCYDKSSLAIRVDASTQTRQLAKVCGGLLLSSSLNRKGGQPGQPDRTAQLNLHRHIKGRLSGRAGTAKASSILRVWRNTCTTIRP